MRQVFEMPDQLPYIINSHQPLTFNILLDDKKLVGLSIGLVTGTKMIKRHNGIDFIYPDGTRYFINWTWFN